MAPIPNQPPQTRVVDLGDGLYAVQWEPRLLEVQGDNPTQVELYWTYAKERQINPDKLAVHLGRLRNRLPSLPASQQAHYEHEVSEGEFCLELIAQAQEAGNA